jgi:hypothetical protein
VAQRLAVQGVEDGVACSVGSGGTSVCLSTFTVFEGLTTESSLVDLAFFGTREWNTVVFKLKVSSASYLYSAYAPR